MIKINLSPLRKPKTGGQGARMVLLALLVWGGTLAIIALVVHFPMTEEIETLDRGVAALQTDNRDKENELKGYEELKRTISDAEERAAVVQRLNEARAVPAHMLYELSRILTPGRLPTTTAEVAKQIEEGRFRELVREWDPSQVWLERFNESAEGAFRLEGIAQADSDMTQLALRLQASIYFYEVVPVGGSEVTLEDGSTQYKFTITGKVAY